MCMDVRTGRSPRFEVQLYSSPQAVRKVVVGMQKQKSGQGGGHLGPESQETRPRVVP